MERLLATGSVIPYFVWPTRRTTILSYAPQLPVEKEKSRCYTGS